MSQGSTGLSRDERRKRTVLPTTELPQLEAPPERLVSKGEDP